MLTDIGLAKTIGADKIAAAMLGNCVISETYPGCGWELFLYYDRDKEPTSCWSRTAC